MKRRELALVLLAGVMLVPASVSAHCEIPCGIYGDQMRVDQIAEHITTVDKSMKKITELGQADEPNWNQLVRWVNNKELHANKIQGIVSEYFLHQRVKPADPSDSDAYTAYTTQLALLHQIAVHAMKAKQTTDLEHVVQLRSLLEKFKAAYFDPEKQAHLHEHHAR
ncbi:MAG: superoxide dismutase [Ni] [Planctomycetota bacterium]